MRKIISIILLFALWIICASGCSINSVDLDTTAKSQTDSDGTFQENTTELQATATTDPTVLQPDDNDLVLALIDYLRELFFDHDMAATSLAIKINEIKNGKRPLHADFDASNYYFVCGYYSAEDEHDESDHYCCAQQYTWFRFDDADEIMEYYEGLKIAVAFQINKADFVTDILSGDSSVPNMEHFQIYKTEFRHGLNTNRTVDFDETFIYLESSPKSNIYHSTAVFNHRWITIPCINLGGKYYVMTFLSTDYGQGKLSEIDYDAEFGEYKDALMSLMEEEKYRVTNKSGTVSNYGLFDINAFVNDIVK